jgi:hypothetical protein
VRAIVVHERGGPEVPELDGGRGRLPLPGTAHNLELTELSFRRRRPTRSRAQLKGAERGETAVCARRTARTNLPIRRERRAPRTEKLTSTGIGGPDSQIRAHIRLGRGFSARWLCLWGRSHWCLGSSQASRFWFRPGGPGAATSRLGRRVTCAPCSSSEAELAGTPAIGSDDRAHLVCPRFVAHPRFAFGQAAGQLSVVARSAALARRRRPRAAALGLPGDIGEPWRESRPATTDEAEAVFALTCLATHLR